MSEYERFLKEIISHDVSNDQSDGYCLLVEYLKRKDEQRVKATSKGEGNPWK